MFEQFVASLRTLILRHVYDLRPLLLLSPSPIPLPLLLLLPQIPLPITIPQAPHRFVELHLEGDDDAAAEEEDEEAEELRPEGRRLVGGGGARAVAPPQVRRGQGAARGDARQVREGGAHRALLPPLRGAREAGRVASVPRGSISFLLCCMNRVINSIC